ncbi:MAG: DUF1292 domain-containing protein [Bacilli bacterium]|nr:DUF1292 domain-containing protein [Bacilli bacterium]MBO6195526.1 DUF1292 domain-containing protein [Bacilli bacterium]
MEETKILVNGEEKTIQLVARLEIGNEGAEYIYYYIVDDNDTEDTEKLLFASRVENDGEYDTFYDIEDEEEKKAVFEAFTTAYGQID